MWLYYRMSMWLRPTLVVAVYYYYCATLLYGAGWRFGGNQPSGSLCSRYFIRGDFLPYLTSKVLSCPGSNIQTTRKSRAPRLAAARSVTAAQARREFAAQACREFQVFLEMTG